MTKKSVLWFGGAVLLIAAFSTFFLHRAEEDSVLANKIDEQVTSGASEIPLSSLTDFDWDQAMVYGPYTDKETIENTLDITFKGSVQGIDYRDDMFLLVFAKGKYAVKTVKLSRAGVHYSANDRILTPEDDALILK